MRKNVYGRHLKRDTDERKGLFKGLISSLILEGRIKTTEPKAKSIKGEVDKLVGKAIKETNSFGNYLSPEILKKLKVEIAPGFKNRTGGYTRIIRLGKRFSDNAMMVAIEWTEMEKVEKLEVKKEARKIAPKKEVKKEVPKKRAATARKVKK